jgi:hypothetical protein
MEVEPGITNSPLVLLDDVSIKYRVHYGSHFETFSSLI